MRTYKPLLLIMAVIVLALGATVIFAQSDDGDTPQNSFDLPIRSDVSYEIQRNDTLDVLAAMFDVRLGCLRETNDLSPASIIHPGDTLIISTDCPAYDGLLVVEFPRPDAPGRTGADGTYVVQPGDTLDTIAQALDISVVSLQRENNITNSRSLTAGQVLDIPADAPPYGQFPALDAPSGSLGGGQGGGVDGELYVIQPGDTLDVIAQELDVSVVSLQVANNITNSRAITPGMTIIIPADAPPYGVFPALDSPDFGEGGGQGGGIDGELYVIQPQDTLDVIAQELDVSLVSIMRANNITNSRAITPGMTIIIPADAPPYGVFPALDSPDFGEGGGQGGGIDGELYVIQPGDTLDVIAQELDVSLVSIMVANEITNSRAITPGMTIIIPADAPAYGLFPALDSPDFGEGGGQGGGVDGELYVIQRGDTLDVIAQEKNVSVVSIMMVNEITNGKSITPGMTILIPADAPPYGQFPAISGVDTSGGGGQGGGVDGELYVVQRGETIDGISARFNKLTSCVLEANGITNSRNVRAGLQIVLPSGCPAYAGAAIPGSTQPTGGSGGFPPPATDTTGEASG